MDKNGMDQLIKSALHQQVTDQEPAAEVRAGLLARAAIEAAQTEQVLGTPIPPVVSGLREARPIVNLPCWLEVEDDLMEFFGSTQQRLVSVWLLASNIRY
jgi:hypothetical protein